MQQVKLSWFLKVEPRLTPWLRDGNTFRANEMQGINCFRTPYTMWCKNTIFLFLSDEFPKTNIRKTEELNDCFELIVEIRLCFRVIRRYTPSVARVFSTSGKSGVPVRISTSKLRARIWWYRWIIGSDASMSILLASLISYMSALIEPYYYFYYRSTLIRCTILYRVYSLLPFPCTLQTPVLRTLSLSKT